METLPPLAGGSPGPVRGIPPSAGGYLTQPDMRRLITTALDLGWSLWAYEAITGPGTDQAGLLSMGFANWREDQQARHLCQIQAAAPG